MIYDSKITTVGGILEELDKENQKVNALRETWIEKKDAFLQDCDRVDAALSGERENLKAEVAELNQTIKRLSGQIAAGVTGQGMDKNVKENLRKLISEATAKRDEAAATLEGLEGVTATYSRELYDAAIAAKDAFLSALNGSYSAAFENLRQVAKELEKEITEINDNFSYRRVSDGLTKIELATVETRMKGATADPGQAVDVPKEPESRMLGQPMRRPAYLDNVPKTVNQAKTRTETFMRDGQVIKQVVDVATGNVISTSKS